MLTPALVSGCEERRALLLVAHNLRLDGCHLDRGGRGGQDDKTPACELSPPLRVPARKVCRETGDQHHQGAPHPAARDEVDDGADRGHDHYEERDNSNLPKLPVPRPRLPSENPVLEPLLNAYQWSPQIHDSQCPPRSQACQRRGDVPNGDGASFPPAHTRPTRRHCLSLALPSQSARSGVRPQPGGAAQNRCGPYQEPPCGRGRCSGLPDDREVLFVGPSSGLPGGIDGGGRYRPPGCRGAAEAVPALPIGGPSRRCLTDWCRQRQTRLPLPLYPSPV